MVTNIKLNQSGDVDLSKGYAEWATETEGVSQHVEIRLQFFQGEWFLDEEDGTPYFEYILGSKDLILARHVLEQRIEETPDMISSLDKLDVLFNTQTRKMTVSFEGETVFSDIDLNTQIG